MTTRRNNNSGGGGCAFIIMNVLALVFIGIGGWYGFGSWRLTQTGNTVTGTVVDIDVSSDEDGQSYAPIIEYEVNGASYNMTGTHTSPAGYDIGDRVKLRYDRSDPSVARIDSFVDLWLLPAIFLPLGLLFLVGYNAFAAVGLYKRMRDAQVSA